MLPLESTMMDEPLLISQILWRIERLYSQRPISTQLEAGGPERTTYGEIAVRARRLASALAAHGVRPGDRVGTFGWNTQRHLECYFAIPSMGAVLHTINVRLFHDQLEFIINHAEDRVIFCDRSVLPTLEALAGRIPSVRLVVLMNEGPEPAGVLPNVIDYEQFLAGGSEDFAWPGLDERSAAAMCYTSGTTGNPKGVVYSHRSVMLHSLVVPQPDAVGISERDAVCFAVPMFHVNAWGLPYASANVGARQVFSNRFLDADRFFRLLRDEDVTIAAGVPTIWIGILALLENGASLPKLQRIICGGSAAPPSMITAMKRHGIEMRHAWGMTETSPLASLSVLRAAMDAAPEDEKLRKLAKQGAVVPLVQHRIVDMETRAELPWDGAGFGELQVRGPYITADYYNDPLAAEKFMDGWLRTGDVATIDSEGYIQIVDRTKDLVKSGGEWISSVELENAIMAHPKVLEAAVVGLPHPRWEERPVAAVVAKPEFSETLAPSEIRDFLAGKFARWWLPDEIVLVRQIPKTSVGKFSKTELRDQLGEIKARWEAAG